MKKTIIIMAVMITALLSAFTSIAQQPSALVYNNKPVSHLSILSGGKTDKANPSLTATVVSDRVNERFRKEFTNVNKADWKREKDGYSVGFVSNGIRHRAFFTKRGNCSSLIRYYTEEHLPTEIRHQIKSVYYDYAIAIVAEVHHNQSTVYLANLTGKNTCITVRIQDGEMDVWSPVAKQ